MPLLRPVLEDLKQGRAHVVLSIQPWQGSLGIERRTPLETAIIEEFHLKERVRETGEIIIVDARIDKSGRQSQLAHVILDGELGRPLRDSRPGPVNRVIRHTAVDVVGDGTGAFGGVGQGAADGDLVAGLGHGIDESERGTLEEGVHQFDIARQWALEEGDIRQVLQLLRDDSLERMDLRAHREPHGGRDADQGRRLSSGRIDDGNGLVWLCHPGWVSSAAREGGEKGRQKGEDDRMDREWSVQGMQWSHRDQRIERERLKEPSQMPQRAGDRDSGVEVKSVKHGGTAEQPRPEASGCENIDRPEL